MIVPTFWGLDSGFEYCGREHRMLQTVLALLSISQIQIVRLGQIMRTLIF